MSNKTIKGGNIWKPQPYALTIPRPRTRTTTLLENSIAILIFGGFIVGTLLILAVNGNIHHLDINYLITHTINTK